MKTIIDTDKLNIQSVQWELKNDGIVPFANFQLLDFIADGIETIKFSREYNTTLNLDGGMALQWNIASLDKRETVLISYEQQGYAHNFGSQYEICQKYFIAKNFPLSQSWPTNHFNFY